MGTIIAIIISLATLTYSPDHSTDYQTNGESSSSTFNVADTDIDGM